MAQDKLKKDVNLWKVLAVGLCENSHTICLEEHCDQCVLHELGFDEAKFKAWLKEELNEH